MRNPGVELGQLGTREGEQLGGIGVLRRVLVGGGCLQPLVGLVHVRERDHQLPLLLLVVRDVEEYGRSGAHVGDATQLGERLGRVAPVCAAIAWRKSSRAARTDASLGAVSVAAEPPGGAACAVDAAITVANAATATRARPENVRAPFLMR